ncbi:MAG: histidinol-phosphatase [Pseudomonadota bacterium]
MISNKTLTSFFHELCDVSARETLPRFRVGIQVDNKQDGGFDPVTQADREAEKTIRTCIEQHFPDHGIIGEEFPDVRVNAEYKWIIDPVDGTRAFVAGLPVWGTLVGLCRNNSPIAGMMFQPFTDERYICAGTGTQLHHKGQVIELTTNSDKVLSNTILMSTAPELFSTSEKRVFDKVSDRCRLTRFGTDCYAYCMLASGHIGMVIESGLQFYDIAALIPIVEQAGGVISDWNGDPITNGGRVLASANPQLHHEALTLITG